MTRQVAIGALIAFTLTVLALSLWQPGRAPEPTPALAPAPKVVAIERAAEVRVEPRELLDATEPTGRPLPPRVRALLHAGADGGLTP